MKFLTMLIGMFVSCSTVAYETDDPVPPQTFLSHPCDRFVKEQETCLLLYQARGKAETESLQIKVVLNARGKPLGFVRESILVVYDPLERNLRTVRLDMPLDWSTAAEPRVLTPSCQVERLKGQTFNKFLFRTLCDGREVFVYAAKYLSVPPTFHSQNPEVMMREATSIVYLSAPPYLVNEEFSLAGQDMILRATEEVLTLLRVEGVQSRAYPGRLVAEVMNKWVPLHLILTEQTDPCLLQNRDRGCQRVIPKNPFQSDEEVMKAVLTEFFLNGHDAFSYLRSSANALGALQFTNTYRIINKRKVTGTYDAVRSEYPKAVLDPDFQSGTEDLHNSIKMAILLIDLELSYRSTPQWVRTVFLEDYRMGFPCPAAAYNGGASQCSKFATLFDAYRRYRNLKEVSFQVFPAGDFLTWIKKHPLAFNSQTHGYLEKVWSISRFLNQ